MKRTKIVAFYASQSGKIWRLSSEAALGLLVTLASGGSYDLDAIGRRLPRTPRSVCWDANDNAHSMTPRVVVIHPRNMLPEYARELIATYSA